MTTKAPKTKKRPIEEFEAGEAFRKSMEPRADVVTDGYYPSWHGWVIMDAFLAGIDWERRRAKIEAGEKVT